jgi:putative sterol carrier protein
MIEEMPQDFRPERAGRANVVVQFHITGESGGDWYITIRDRTCTVVEGVAPKANAKLTMDAGDYVDLATGKLSSMKAFSSRRIKPSGDIALLKRMDRWFVRGR